MFSALGQRKMCVCVFLFVLFFCFKYNFLISAKGDNTFVFLQEKKRRVNAMGIFFNANEGWL